jgi:hypothetical protein
LWRLEKFLAAPGGLSFELEYAHGKGTEGRVVGDVNRVAVRLRDTHQTRNSPGALDVDERSRFLMGRSAILSARSRLVQRSFPRARIRNTRALGRDASPRSSASLASNIGPVTSVPCSTLSRVNVRTSPARSIATPDRALALESSTDLDGMQYTVYKRLRMCQPLTQTSN